MTKYNCFGSLDYDFLNNTGYMPEFQN